jgi:hypothetical protein
MLSRSRDMVLSEAFNFVRSLETKRAHATLKRGRREDRVRAAPAVSCAMGSKEDAHEHTGSAETLRPSLRNGFTAYTRSPWRPCCATIAPGEALAS